MQEGNGNKKCASFSKNILGWNVHCKNCNIVMYLEHDNPQICGIWEWYFKCQQCSIKKIITEYFNSPNNCEIEEEWIENQ